MPTHTTVAAAAPIKPDSHGLTRRFAFSARFSSNEATLPEG